MKNHGGAIIFTDSFGRKEKNSLKEAEKGKEPKTKEDNIKPDKNKHVKTQRRKKIKMKMEGKQVEKKVLHCCLSRFDRLEGSGHYCRYGYP